MRSCGIARHPQDGRAAIEVDDLLDGVTTQDEPPGEALQVQPPQLRGDVAVGDACPLSTGAGAPARRAAVARRRDALGDHLREHVARHLEVFWRVSSCRSSEASKDDGGVSAVVSPDADGRGRRERRHGRHGRALEQILGHAAARARARPGVHGGVDGGGGGRSAPRSAPRRTSRRRRPRRCPAASLPRRAPASDVRARGTGPAPGSAAETSGLRVGSAGARPPSRRRRGRHRGPRAAAPRLRSRAGFDVLGRANSPLPPSVMDAGMPCSPVGAGARPSPQARAHARHEVARRQGPRQEAVRQVLHARLVGGVAHEERRDAAARHRAHLGEGDHRVGVDDLRRQHDEVGARRRDPSRQALAGLDGDRLEARRHDGPADAIRLVGASDDQQLIRPQSSIGAGFFAHARAVGRSQRRSAGPRR